MLKINYDELTTKMAWFAVLKTFWKQLEFPLGL